MGIFDRFHTTVPSNTNGGKPDTSVQDATRLIDEGHALEAEGKLDEAMQRYLEAIRLAPNPARGHLNRGNILLLKSDLQGALDAFLTALEHQPDYAGAYYNIGNALLGNQQLDEAAASFRSALQINPDYAEVHCSLGVVLYEQGKLEEAVQYHRRALEINPDFVEAHTNLGNTLQALGQFESAAASYRRALELNPDLAEAYSNLGLAMKELRQLECAMENYRQALKIKPDSAEALCNLGHALTYLGQLDNAMDSFHRALKIKPDQTEARSGLLFSLNYTAGHSPLYYLDQARQYGRIVSAKVGARFSEWPCAGRPQRLRVGLVSGDLRNHPVGFFLEGLLAHIDPSLIELIAYPTHYIEDELTARIRPYFSNWHPLVGKNDEAAARLIHADGVHVLIDLSGHTGHNRLPVFVWKPAPVQVTWLGLPTTTGVAEIDYVLGDPHAIPLEFDDHFSESVWRIPDSYLCLTVPDSSVTVAALPALSAGYVTFGSFNNLTKMTDAVVAVWARILKAVPGSRLLLKTKQLSDPAVCLKTQQRFAACGIAPDRLILGGILASRDDHLAAYNNVDIALDTFPYPGVTTSAEALWMGVPVLSRLGDRFISRTAGSIAHNAGLPDWIAADEDEYVAKAVASASDLQRLAALRAGLRQQVLASPLFDAPLFARNFEDALWGMWDRYQAQQGNLERFSDGSV
jgi:protein O-GlcNAc transferase